MASIGDINGDGFADFAAGAMFDSPGGQFMAGSAFVIFGTDKGFSSELDVSTLDGTNGFRVDGPASYSNLGWVSGGDVNGDGFADLIVGAFADDPLGRPDAGAAYVIFGHSGTFAPDVTKLDGTNGFEIVGATAHDYTGLRTASAGDINGDGYTDIIIGAPGTGAGATPGAAYVIFGHAGGFDASIDLAALTSGQGFKVTGPTNGSGIGASVSSAGDLNGDGYGDFAVGAPARAGDVYVFYGHGGSFSDIDVSKLSADQGFKIHGVTEGDNTGAAVSAIGDVNGDGYADLLIGAPGNVVENDPGTAYVIYGHDGGFGNIDLKNLDSSQGFKLEGLSFAGNAGYAVSGGGDINGDGYADLVVGAPWVDPDGVSATIPSGAAYVIFGGNFTGHVTHLGTNGADTMTGTILAERFVAGGGDDTINAGGGKDVVEAGAGNDHIHVTDNTFFRIDGGTGSDTLHLDYAGAIDFGNLDGNAATSDRGKIAGIETISVDNGKFNALTLHYADVLDMNPTNHDVDGKASLDNVLKIDGNAGDTLHLDAFEHWSAADTSTLAGYAIYTNHDVKVAIETAIAVIVS
jgi:hypothetical protein